MLKQGPDLLPGGPLENSYIWRQGRGERFRQPCCLLLALVSLSVFPKGRCLSFPVGQAMSRGYQGMGAACNNTWALDQGDAAWKKCSGFSNMGMMCTRRKNMIDQR